MAASSDSASSPSPSSRPGAGPVVRSHRGRHPGGQAEPQLGVVGRKVFRAHPAALDQQPARPAGPGDIGAQPGAGPAQVRLRQRAVTHPAEQGLERGQRLGVGGVPLGQELLVLLVEQLVHRDPAVGQRRGHPPLLDLDIGPAGGRIGRGQQVGIDLARGEPLFEVADQPGVHLGGELAALGLLIPHVQADNAVRLGPGGFQPRPDVPDRGVAVGNLVQDGFCRRPEHRGQRVARGEHPPPDAGQRGEGVGWRRGEQRHRHIAPGQPAKRSARQVGYAISFKVHAGSVRSSPSGARASSPLRVPLPPLRVPVAQSRSRPPR